MSAWFDSLSLSSYAPQSQVFSERQKQGVGAVPAAASGSGRVSNLQASLSSDKLWELPSQLLEFVTGGCGLEVGVAGAKAKGFGCPGDVVFSQGWPCTAETLPSSSVQDVHDVAHNILFRPLKTSEVQRLS